MSRRPVDALEAMATVEANDKAWRADMHMAVMDEARRTGQSPVAVAATHSLSVTLSPLSSPLPGRLWQEYVAWATGHLDRATARRWERATGVRRWRGGLPETDS